MIGGNNMLLNQATLMAALQHYFDTVLFAPGKAPKVTGIDKCSTPSYSTTNMFEIKLNSPFEEKK